VTMLIDTMLVFVCARRRWGWSVPMAVATLFVIFLVDTGFVLANLVKIAQGAWVPLLVTGVVFTVMMTWIRGRALLRDEQRESELPLDVCTTGLGDSVTRVPGTAIFMTSRADRVPRTLLHNLKHNKVLHDRVVFLTVVTEEEPRVPHARRVDVDTIAPGFLRVVAHFGFMETPDIPEILASVVEHGIEFDLMDTTFFFSRDRLVFGAQSPMAGWRRKLFAFLSRNAQPATQHFGVPPNRVVEIGAQMEI
jgi:KUP system potassium uptake protein